MTDTRQQIFAKLKKLSWYQDTAEDLQWQLQNLPEDYDPFLSDLSERADETGELDVLRLTKIGYGNFLIMVVFDVRSHITNQVFSYEYVSWRTGHNPGTRGIIFLETKGEISHFLVSQTHKFSTGTEVYDSIGGLYLHIFENKLENLPKKVENEIKFHLGVENLEFKKIYNLGRAHPDYGMSNNQSDLFAAIIDISHLPNLVTKSDFRTTHKPVGLEIKIVHISEFTDYIQNKIEDNYFLSAAARILVHPDFSLQI